MRFLTDFADQAVVLPVIAVIVVSLAIQGWSRGAAAWLAATAATFGLTLILKLIFLGCGGSLGIMSLHSPSGHAASAGLICGGVLARFVSSVPLTLVAATLGAVVIGYTRVVLDFHSVDETVLGGVIGIAGAAALCVMAGTPPRMRTLPLVLAIIAVVVALHGKRLPAEPAIREASSLIRLLLPWCQPAAPDPGRRS